MKNLLASSLLLGVVALFTVGCGGETPKPAADVKKDTKVEQPPAPPPIPKMPPKDKK